jgi:hypothetical protein
MESLQPGSSSPSLMSFGSDDSFAARAAGDFAEDEGDVAADCAANERPIKQRHAIKRNFISQPPTQISSSPLRQER